MQCRTESLSLAQIFNKVAKNGIGKKTMTFNMKVDKKVHEDETARVQIISHGIEFNG